MFNKGDLIGNYVLQEQIGQGTFGVVWLAATIDESELTSTPIVDNKKLVAIKVIQIYSGRNDTEVLKEANLWASVSGNKHIIAFIEAKQLTNNQIALISEFADGGSLESLIENNGGHLSVEKASDIICEILIGLKHLHSQNIIHRDIKPANICIKNGVFCLVDFGISTIIDTGLTQTAKVLGTPRYMSPESFDKRRNAQTDIWAVGVVFYQLLCGAMPFEGNDWSLVYSITTKDPTLLPDDIPIPIRDVVFRALEKDPSKRYASAEQMRTELIKAKAFLEPTYLVQRIKELEKEIQEMRNITNKVALLSSKLVEGVRKDIEIKKEYCETTKKSLLLQVKGNKDSTNTTFPALVFVLPSLLQLVLQVTNIYDFNNLLLSIISLIIFLVFRSWLHRRYSKDLDKLDNSLKKTMEKSTNNTKENTDSVQILSKLIQSSKIY